MRENVSNDICPNEKYTVVKNNAHKSRVNSCFARSLSTFYLCTMASDVLAEEMEVCRTTRM